MSQSPSSMQVPPSQLSFGQGMLPPQFASTPPGQINPGPTVSYVPNMPCNMPMSSLPAMVPGSTSISDHDVQRIAMAVKNLMHAEITQLMTPYQITIENLAKQNKDLARRVDELEAYSRRNLIRVSGVSEEEKDTTAALLKIGEKIGVPIEAGDIEVSHRVGPTDQGKPRQIIARIKKYHLRHRLIKSNKKLRETSGMSGIYINQDLSKARSKLAYQARQLAREQKLKGSFVYDGKVIAVTHDDRKHTIQSLDDMLRVVESPGSVMDSANGPPVLGMHPTPNSG